MKKIAAIVALLMMKCAAPTTILTSYQDWDSNHDGSIQRPEFVEGYVYSNYFGRWGKGKGSISYDDFLSDAFSFIDEDQNSKLDKTEFDSQINAYYFGMMSNPFEQWDDDTNSSIDKIEFNKHALKSNLASLWDNDNDKRISEQEMATGMYDQCNTNKDSKVDEQELNVWKAKRNRMSQQTAESKKI